MSDIDLTKYEGHTPGEWKVLEKFIPLDCGAIRVIRGFDKSSITICECTPRDELLPGSTVETVMANAALIADAPFLLAEVQRLQEHANNAYTKCFELIAHRDELAGALEKCVDLLDEEHAADPNPLKIGNYKQHCIKTARAVLDKVKGGGE